jgi:hypothetical protein
MMEAISAYVMRFWRYTLWALLFLFALAAVWFFFRGAGAWDTYRSEGPPVYSVKYLKILDVRPDYIDPVLVGGEQRGAVNFSYPPSYLLGSRITNANITITPVTGVSCDMSVFLPLATTTRRVEEGGVEYIYARYINPEREALQFVYLLQGEPCVVVRYHFNLIQNNGYDPDAPPSIAQSRTKYPEKSPAPGKVQFADVAKTFDTIRASLRLQR